MKNIKRQSQDARLLAIGDIHGCYRHLARLLKRISLTPGDRLVFLGDYIDRGPQSRDVIEKLIALQKDHPQTIFLRGNHEQMMLEALRHGDTSKWLANGGQATLDDYGTLEAVPPAHRTFLEETQLCFETDAFIFVHAGLRPGFTVADQNPFDMLWIRDVFLTSSYHWGKTVVFGHTAFTQPFVTQNRLGLDTGAVYGGVLTYCDVQRRQFATA